MMNDDRQSPDLSFRLSRKGWIFNSPKIENLYRQWHLSEMLPYSRLAALSGISTWIIGLLLIEFVLDIESVPSAIPYTIAFILLLSSMLLISSLNKNLNNFIKYLAIGIINSEIFFTIWLLEIFLELPNTANQAVILLSFYAFGLSRLPPKIVLISVLPGICFAFYYHVSNYLDASTNIVVLSAKTFMLYAAIFIGVVFLLKFDQILRKEFSAQKFIEYQKTLLLEEKAQLSKFLAPEVSEMVRDKGIQETLSVKSIELSAVYCDLRGFTHYTDVSGSEKMADLLHDYYQIVIDTAKRYGGTIKDFAGDGILILLGAPIEKDNHKQSAIELARDGEMVISEESIKGLTEFEGYKVESLKLTGFTHKINAVINKI